MASRKTHSDHKTAVDKHWFSCRHQTATEHNKAHDAWRERQECKVARAEVAQEEMAKLTPKERLAELDERLGPDVGAKRERARLAARS